MPATDLIAAAQHPLVADKREATIAPQDAPVRLLECVATPVAAAYQPVYRGLLLFPAGLAIAGTAATFDDPRLTLLWLAVALYAFLSAVQLLARNR